MSDLKTHIEKFKQEVINKASSEIKALADIAKRLDIPETASRFLQQDALLRSDTFNLIIAGRFKNGKSTLMNALLGRTTHPVHELKEGKGAMPEDDLPCTATLTSINYSEKPTVKVWKFDGSYEIWSLDKYVRESVLRDDNEENTRIFSKIRQFELGFPSELCKAGVTMLDSPGTDEHPKRTEVTIEAVERSDAAIVVYRSDVFGGKSWEEFAAKHLPKDRTRIFTIVNMFHGRQADERFKGFVWNKLVHEMQGGPKYSNQSFTEKDIYFIDAAKARHAVALNDNKVKEESGLMHFEQCLGIFLIKNRHITHIKRFIDTSNAAADGLLDNINQRKFMLNQATQELKERYEKIKPQLENIKNRASKLPTIFDRYSRNCQRDLKVSFESMLNQLRYDLPNEIKNRSLPSLQSTLDVIKSPFNQKKLGEEATEICNAIIKESIDKWNRTSATEIIKSITNNMMEQITEEINRVEQEFKDVHLDLGYSPQAATAETATSISERVLAAGAGLLLGDITLIAAGGSGGTRGIIGAALAQVATGVVLGILGVTSLPIIAVASILAAIVGGGAGRAYGLEARVKEKMVEEALKSLRDAPSEAFPIIDSKTIKAFDNIKNSITQSTMAVIREEEQNINKMIEENQQDQAQKAATRNMLEDCARQVVHRQKTLKEILNNASQKL